MSKEIIYSCPFCGSIEVEICRTNEYACWIRCGECGADAEYAPTRHGAIENWNRRHPRNIRSAVIIDDMDK